MSYITLAAGVILLLSGVSGFCSGQMLPRDDGYHGIWYDMGRKYSGGLGTYPQQQLPIAIYAPAVHKTFFCYGGTVKGERRLLYMVSYYDHSTGLVPRPRILFDKQTDDAHDNPTMALDERGHIWVFGNSHGTARPSYIFRSDRPYDIDSFQQVLKTNFSYGQPWFIPGQGFIFLHTRYRQGIRELFWMTSADGMAWEDPRLLASFFGHYQVTWRCGGRLGSMFNCHPGGLDRRTNLYYVETPDMGRTWTNAAGQTLQIPLTDIANPALVYDYLSEGLLVYLKDLQFDADGRPVLLYLTSRGHQPVPENGPRIWRTARWDGARWIIRRVTTSDHNYDHGSLYIEKDGTWRIIAPTEPGPRPWDTGGEMVMWTSRDQGLTWKREKQLTRNSPRNHTYARRPVDAHPGFYALWADGDTMEESPSFLYFATRDGRVFRLPPQMSGEFARPEEVK